MCIQLARKDNELESSDHPDLKARAGEGQIQGEIGNGVGRKYSLKTNILEFFFFNLINLFIFGCVGSSFLCEGFLQLQRAGDTLHRGVRASHCRGLSCCGAQAPDAQAQ